MFARLLPHGPEGASAPERPAQPRAGRVKGRAGCGGGAGVWARVSPFPSHGGLEGLLSTKLWATPQPTRGTPSTRIRYWSLRRMLLLCRCLFGTGGHGNGPRRLDTQDIRGDISNSEGMDAPNLWFNNSDMGQNF